LREKARLQTFPDSFLFSGSKTEIRAQIGEAVPPIAAKRLAHALAEVLMDIENK
jgi:DNA (cytosine-5)-methyltransferase 1